MVRTQIQLTEEQYRRLKQLAADRGVSIAEVIRRSVDSMFTSEALPDHDALRAKARTTFGAFADSRSDVSTDHDKYLPEAFEA